jgi:hypothetical protein
VEGTGLSEPFTIASQPAQSIIDYQFASFRTGNIMQIYVNGILTISPAIGATGSFNVATGSSVRGVIQGINNSGDNMNLRTTDVTTASLLDNQVGTIPGTFNYTFIANGDEFSILATVTP